MPGVVGAMFSDDVPNLSLTMSSDEEEVLVVWLIRRRKKKITRSSYWIHRYVNGSCKIGSSAVAGEMGDRPG
jgi:hypothetical protein